MEDRSFRCGSDGRAIHATNICHLISLSAKWIRSDSEIFDTIHPHARIRPISGSALPDFTARLLIKAEAQGPARMCFQSLLR